MAKKITEIYKEYKIPPSLQMHMLRVAAVASLICDNFEEPLEKEEIVTACLLHDLGNIIKFRMHIFQEFFEPEGVDYWREVQAEFKETYGEDEHQATVEILKELGLSERIISIVDQVDFSFYCKLKDSQDLATKIVVYSDSRVGPHGVLSFTERMEEGKKRYQNHKSTFGAMAERERQVLVACGQETEKQIFARCRIRPEDITDKSIEPIISELKNFVVKC